MTIFFAMISDLYHSALAVIKKDCKMIMVLLGASLVAFGCLLGIAKSPEIIQKIFAWGLISVVIAIVVIVSVCKIYESLKERWKKAQRRIEFEKILFPMFEGFRLAKTFRSDSHSIYDILYYFMNDNFVVRVQGPHIQIWTKKDVSDKENIETLHKTFVHAEFPLHKFLLTEESSEIEDIKRVLDALREPSKLPLCINIEWAKPLIEEWMKND